MTTLMIRKLDPEVKRQLRRLAAEHGVSMEQEAREALARGIAAEQPRRKPALEAMTRLGVKPEKPFDLKKVSDEMWGEGLR